MNLKESQCAEQFWEVEELLLQPGSFGDCTLEDAVTSLASEFTHRYEDEEIVGRLFKLVAAESAGDLKAARRHLRFALRKAKAKFEIVPVPSEPLVESEWDEYVAWRSRKPRSPGSKSS